MGKLTTLSPIEGRPVDFCLKENGERSVFAIIEAKCTNWQAANESAQCPTRVSALYGACSSDNMLHGFSRNRGALNSLG
jgi:hypothetical protein